MNEHACREDKYNSVLVTPMDQEMLFTGSKWEIITTLAHSSKSPLEISRQTRQSIANVSSQLRLLEMAGIVTHVRVPNRDKGQPRIVYSLAKDIALVITATRTHAEKRIVDIDQRDVAVLRLFLASQNEARHLLQKAFWQLEPDLGKIQAILVDPAGLVMHVMTHDATIRKRSSVSFKQAGDTEASVRLAFFDREDVGAMMKRRLFVIHDPQNLFAEKRVGGVES